MSDSNELNFGLPLDEQIESTSENTLGLGITEPTDKDEKEIKGLGYSPEHLYQTSDSSMIPDYDTIHILEDIPSKTRLF